MRILVDHGEEAVNEIIRRWKNLEQLDEENRLFEIYVRIRAEYQAGARRHVRGEIGTDELKQLYLAERAAFEAYRKNTAE